jgi:hypothetical protein
VIFNIFKLIKCAFVGQKTLMIKMDLQEVGCGGVDRIHLAQDKDRWQAHANVVMKPRVP